MSDPFPEPLSDTQVAAIVAEVIAKSAPPPATEFNKNDIPNGFWIYFRSLDYDSRRRAEAYLLSASEFVLLEACTHGLNDEDMANILHGFVEKIGRKALGLRQSELNAVENAPSVLWVETDY